MKTIKIEIMTDLKFPKNVHDYQFSWHNSRNRGESSLIEALIMISKESNIRHITNSFNNHTYPDVSNAKKV